MWLNKEIRQSMFVEKVKNQTQELEKAQQMNQELSKKHQRLEEERKNLNQLVNSNQVEIVTGKNNLNSLLNELKTYQQLNLDVAQRLEIYTEQIDLIQSSIDQINNSKENSLSELEPIKEKLSFKWDVVDCLQKMLVRTRLQVAEKEAILLDLKQHKADLDHEIMIFKKTNTGTDGTVSQLQEEFLLARIREADVILEFDKLKRCIAIIKQELNEKNNQTSQGHEDEDGFQIRFSLRTKFHENIKMEEDISIVNTVALQNEMDHIKMQIKRLKSIKEDITKRVYFNEEVKVHLHEVRTSIFHRLQKTNYELNRVIAKYKQLEGRMKTELAQIQNSIDSKDVTILELAGRISDLHLKNEHFIKSNNISNMNEQAVNELEEKMKKLEEKIDFMCKN